MKIKIHGLLVLIMLMGCVTATYFTHGTLPQRPNRSEFEKLPREIQYHIFEEWIAPAKTIPELYNLVKKWDSNPVFAQLSHEDRHAILKKEKEILKSIALLLPHPATVPFEELKFPVEQLVSYINRIRPFLPEDPVEREEELKKLDFVLGTSIAQRFSLLKPILTTLLLNFRAYGTGEVQYELVSKLLENGANQNAITGKLYKMPEKTEMIFYKGPVLQGLIFGDGQTIETIIAAERIGQPVPTFEKWPDLDIHVGIIRLLLQKKADPNQKSPGGITCAEGISNMWLWNNRPENQQGNRHVHQINQFCEQAMNILLSFGAHVTPLVLNNAQTLLGFGVKQLASQLYYNNQRLEILGKQSGTKRKYEEGGNAN